MPIAGPGDGRRKLEELGLSTRQLEVLELLASGRTNAEIGHVLAISPSTASDHVGNIIARLGVTSRVEAAAVATRLGLVDESPVPGATFVPGARAAARTFMFTDIVGSTALIDVIGDLAWSALRAWHDATLRRLFEAHGGVEVDHAGDGFFVTFPSPTPAVTCAVAIQRTLAEHREAAGFAPGVRIGLHHGEALSTGTGWAGRDVHVASRLMARAGAGEIVASAATLTAARIRPADAQPVSLPGLAGIVAVALVSWR
jgi:class 3 adenylate cyclase